MIPATLNIPIEHTSQSRLDAVDFENLEFGQHLSDHMLIAEYDHGAWQTPSVVPYGDLRMSPAMLALHYGQSVFEGMKAFRMHDGRINIFRPHKHLERINKSLERMCMPAVPDDLWFSSLRALVETDHAWVPDTDGASLYIRPIIFATEARLGVKVADQYKLIILTSPVGPYQAKPYRLKVEDYYVRTAEGGTGFAKCAGNYGGAFYPTQLARDAGFDQVLWTDHKEHRYIDEVGMMNVMFVINGSIITPKLSTAILDGVTRDSILQLTREFPSFKVEERRITIDEVVAGFENGMITEAFGTGTAAVVAPIALINIRGKEYQVPVAGPTSFQHLVKKKLNNIRLGLEPDPYGWNFVVNS